MSKERMIRAKRHEFLDRMECTYDGHPCGRQRRCYGCDRMHLEDLPNSKAETKYIIWEDDFGEGGTGYAKCPECHELAYGMAEADENGIGQCPFCGLHYQYDEEGKKKAEPNPEETLVCMHCGQRTLVGSRAKSNGHFHGRCTNCGSTIIA